MDDITPTSLYPTHINRNTELMDDAIALARRGCYVDLDTANRDLGQWVPYYREHGGPLDRLTISSDANTSMPVRAPGGTLERYERPASGWIWEQVRSCVREHDLPLEELLPHCTSNTAAVLKLQGKGRIEVGMDADLLAVDAATLDIVHVWARGRQMVRDRKAIVKGWFE